MEGSNSSDTTLTKRELLTLLYGQVQQWRGNAGLWPMLFRHIEALHDDLAYCPLFLAEQAWLSNSRLFAQRALRQKPDTWLKRIWLRDLENWQDYLDSEGYGAGSCPQPEPFSHGRQATLAPELREMLKFGVKPWF